MDPESVTVFKRGDAY